MLRMAVVTPSLNQGRFIERTVRSVLDQGYPDLEYVVRDGGSTDATLQILDGFLVLKERVKVNVSPDAGQADAVNQGIQATSGELIGWLNSDDVYAPGALHRVAAEFEARPEVDVLYGDAQLIDADDRPLGAYGTQPWDPARLAERCFVCQPAAFFRRRVVERFGLLDVGLRYCLDYEYWLRLADGGAVFAYLPSRLACSRLHPDTKTLSARLAVHHELNTMLRQRLGRVPESWLLNHAHTLVELRRATGRAGGVPYAVEVVVQAARLSVVWNGGISRRLVADALTPLARGARRRIAQSRSAETIRPAS